MLRPTLALPRAVLLVLAPSAFSGIRNRLRRPRRPLLPQAGNGGYDALHYDLTLFRPARQPPRGHGRDRGDRDREPAPLQPRLPQLLPHLESGRWTAKSVCVQRQVQELQIDPATNINEGEQFTVQVDYAGKPRPIKDPDKSIEDWVPHRRRRLRRQRAARRAGFVPG